uniref:7,8-epoxymelianol synthase CYP88A154 n=1 Tax=Ailanthus altissima TaxID=2768810 RepID=CA154_AILAL|nr:CYP88A154 [Ailanthus altissimus]
MLRNSDIKMDFNFLWLILAIFVGTYVVLFGFLRRVNDWYYVSRLGEKRHSLPPGEMGWPLLGNMLSFIRAFRTSDPDTFIYNLVDRYGRTGIYKSHLFWSPSIVVCTPETCKTVLMDNERFGRGNPESTKELLGKKTLGLSNEEHKRLRKLTTNPFRGDKALTMYVGYIEDIVIDLLDEWAGMNKHLVFLTEMRKLAFKVIGHIVFGTTSDHLLELMEKYYTDLLLGLRSPAINIPGFAFYRALKARKLLVKLLQDVLDERKKLSGIEQQKGKKGMIDLLIEAEDENGKKLEDDNIIDLLIINLLAGHESSAHASMWAVLYLYQHPEMLQKAKEEQEEIIKRRPSTQKGLTLEEIKQMEYLSKIIDETMRRTSLFIPIFREAKTDAKIQGYTVPKGWQVLVWTRGVHMDPEVYSNPKEFDPSRWDNHAPKPGSYIPFGGGPWICSGADLTKLEIYIFLHYFLLNYKLELLNPKCPVAYLPVPRPSDNCVAKVVKLK